MDAIISEIIGKTDKAGNGTISLSEFTAMMNTDEISHHNTI